MGGKAEDKFRITMANRGHSVASVSKDMQFQHVDFLLDNKVKVEVKSAKRISRQDKSSTAQYIWVEISSIYYKEGKNGWLYGAADLIAFENGGHFIFVNRKELVTLVESICDLTTFVKKPEEALYKSYRRWDRPTEQVCLIKVEDLYKISNKKVPIILSPEGSYYLCGRNSPQEDFSELEGWTLDFNEVVKRRDAALREFQEVIIKQRKIE